MGIAAHQLWPLGTILAAKIELILVHGGPLNDNGKRHEHGGY